MLFFPIMGKSYSGTKKLSQKKREATLSARDTRENDDTSDRLSILLADRVAKTACPIAFKVCVVECSFILHAALLHDPSGSGILRFAFSDDPARSEHAKLIREHRSHRFGHVAVPPEATMKRIATCSRAFI